MQLLAGVKLCTGRTLTNHPHYEDSGLRARTRAVRAMRDLGRARDEVGGRVQGSGPAPWEVRPRPLIGHRPQVYQVYARRPPEEVHALLRALGADFVILEDSICFERRHRRGCRLRDLLDVANGHVSAGGWAPGLWEGPGPEPAWSPGVCTRAPACSWLVRSLCPRVLWKVLLLKPKPKPRPF